MRTVEIVTNGKTFVIVDLPNGYDWCQKTDKWISFIHLPLDEQPLKKIYGDFTAVGFALSLTEKEWAGILGTVKYSGFTVFKDYADECNAYFKTATESGKSWLEANGIADFKNPFILIKK